jgi:hypothetical protein
MTFRVRPEALEGYGRQVGRAAEDVQQAEEYINKHGDLDVLIDQGLILAATGLHSQAMDSVREVLARMDSLLRAGAQELSKSAHYYRTTDTGEAAGLDAACPSSKR